MIKFSHRHGFINRESYVAQYLALAILVTGIVSTIGSDDLLAAFAAGLFTPCLIAEYILSVSYMVRLRGFLGWRIHRKHRRGSFCLCHGPPSQLRVLRLYRGLDTLRCIYIPRTRYRAMAVSCVGMWDSVFTSYTGYPGIV